MNEKNKHDYNIEDHNLFIIQFPVPFLTYVQVYLNVLRYYGKSDCFIISNTNWLITLRHEYNNL